MQGFLLVDKPAGMTSHDVVYRVRRLSGVKRVGHAGTLDPMATGLLPVAIGDATRLIEFVADREKGYLARMRLGAQTDTQDAEGEVIATAPWQDVSQEQLAAVLSDFTGAIEQIPPMYSALKRGGVPLYKLARQGREVERAPRPVEIAELELLSFEPPDVELRVLCSKGTYIRTLCHDIGLTLGCGAHMTALRRYRHGGFSLDQSVPLAVAEEQGREALEDRLLSPLEVLADLPLGQVAESACARLANGVPPGADDVAFGGVAMRSGELVGLASDRGLLAVARYVPERTREVRGDFELVKVFHPPSPEV